MNGTKRRICIQPRRVPPLNNFPSCHPPCLRYLPLPKIGNGLLTPLRGFAAISLPFGEKLMYAVIETGSKQYRVSPGDTIEVELLEAEEGKEVTLDRVLFVANEGKFSVGAPLLDKAGVVADVVKHIRGPKLIAFKMKRRKGYHRTVGHRQELTVLKIKEVKI